MPVAPFFVENRPLSSRRLSATSGQTFAESDVQMRRLMVNATNQEGFEFSAINVEDTDADNSDVSLAAAASDANWVSLLNIIKKRGTQNVPETVLDDDALGAIQFWGRHATANQVAASIIAYAVEVGAAIVGGKLLLAIRNRAGTLIDPVFIEAAAGADAANVAIGRSTDLLSFHRVTPVARQTVSGEGQALMDALEALGLIIDGGVSFGPQTAGKDGNTTRTSTSLADDTDFNIAVEANSFYHFRYVLYPDALTTNEDFQYDITGPSGATGRHAWLYIAEDGSTGGDHQEAIGTAGTISGMNSTNERTLIIDAYIDTDSTAGNVVFRWAPVNAAGSGTQLRAGSHVIATKLTLV